MDCCIRLGCDPAAALDPVAVAHTAAGSTDCPVVELVDQTAAEQTADPTAAVPTAAQIAVELVGPTAARPAVLAADPTAADQAAANTAAESVDQTADPDRTAGPEQRL